jgi:Aspartyl protease
MNKAIKARVSLYTEGKKAETEALLDSEATESLINPRLIKQHRLPTKQLPKGRKLFNVDGTLNKQGEITKVVILTIQCKNHCAPHRFLVADIGEDDIILGYPFFEATNPQIDWPTGVVGKPISLSSHKESRREDVARTSNAARKVTVAEQLAEQATNKKERTWEEQVPTEYHKHEKVFSEQASERFPGKRRWDHAIDLKSDAPTFIDCRVYPLAPKEKEKQRKFLEANLRLQRIR